MYICTYITKVRRLSGCLHGAEASTSVQKEKKDKDKKKITSKKEKISVTPKTPNMKPDPIQCCICMEWHTAPDEEVYAGAIWTCQTCRTAMFESNVHDWASLVIP